MDLDKEKQMKPINPNDKSYEALVQENINLNRLLEEWDRKLVKAKRKIKTLKKVIRILGMLVGDLMD